MLIHDSLITKVYWEPLFKRICRCFKLGLYRRVSDDVYMMTLRKYRLYVGAEQVDDCFHIYGWYYMIQRNGWSAWEIYQSYIFKNHRGQGWSHKIFDAMVEKDKLMIASGPSQTHHARALWRKLVAKDCYNIWAHDFKNLDLHSQVSYDPDNDALDCALTVYDLTLDGEAKRRDVRLIATRKQHDSCVYRPN